jgi:deoxycytidine triphosphate deaminase
VYLGGAMTNLLRGEEIVSSAEGLISAKKQQGEFSLDLTVNTISRINTGGALDFGGSEYREASVSLLEPEKKTPDEPYGWWNLDTGDYLIRFNERIKIPAKGLIMVLPHERLLAAGASHAPISIENLDQNISVPIHVGSAGLKIKQNARVSKAVVISSDR